MKLSVKVTALCADRQAGDDVQELLGETSKPPPPQPAVKSMEAMDSMEGMEGLSAEVCYAFVITLSFLSKQGYFIVWA